MIVAIAKNIMESSRISRHPLRTANQRRSIPFLRAVLGALGILGFFSGSAAAPLRSEMTQAEIERALAEPASPLHRFIDTLEHATLVNDAKTADSLIDADAILDRATRCGKFSGDTTLRELFCESTAKAWGTRAITRDYLDTDFRFLRAHTLGGRAGLLFRASGERGGLNYAMLTIRSDRRGSFVATDIFIVGLNEFLSDTLRRTWINVAGSYLQDEDHQLQNVNLDYVSHMNEIANVSRHVAAGRHGPALAALRELPPSLQSDRSVLLLRIEAAERFSAEERTAAFDAWLAANPDEMNLPLKLADYYASMGRWTDAERVLTLLINEIGPDMRLKMQRGTALHRARQSGDLVSHAALE
jgi:hypothetical protein